MTETVLWPWMLLIKFHKRKNMGTGRYNFVNSACRLWIQLRDFVVLCVSVFTKIAKLQIAVTVENTC